jgi:prolyl oligopeptidase
MRCLLLTAAIAFIAGTPMTPPGARAQTPDATTDPYLWLEAAESPRALAWVEQQNARSLAVLKGDPRYAQLHAEALAIVNATDRIPTPSLIGRTIYNFWQDPAHVRGLWRRTSRDDYAAAEPPWETVLDLDALSAAEKANWVWKGANCPPPDYRRCLVQLSDGGEDAVRVREFDLATKAFVADGFDLPRGKQTVDWLDADTLIVSRDWGPATTTASGYPFVVKTLKRGQRFDQATEVFRGEASDVGVDPSVLHDAQGHKLVLIERATDFFHVERWMLADHGPVRLDLPQKASVDGLLDGLLIVTVQEDWNFQSQRIKAGSVIAVAPDRLTAPRSGETRVSNPVAVIFEPDPRQSVDEVSVTAGRVLTVVYDNVSARLFSFENQGGRGWRRNVVPLSDHASAAVATASEVDDAAFVNVESFLEPSRLYQIDAANVAAPRQVKALPARFDAARDRVEQFEATSSDGTRIPYFVVHPKTMPLDGSNPTLLYAYGGFQVSELPTYSANIGKLWLERGGVYVLANIRGGGEFGPAWHEAGLKTHRQRIYDDFTAVTRDLIARKITSPRRLGIEGGSNGGLLMGVEFTQHPELWNAVVIQVPLLDMLRFETIGAGASWVGEYGSVGNPDEAAFLRSISPYHNLKAGTDYPEPFFVTSTKDDRVTPVHARKMAARMQAMGLAFLYFENINGGHAASANLQERAERAALEFTYLTRKLVDDASVMAPVPAMH